MTQVSICDFFPNFTHSMTFPGLISFSMFSNLSGTSYLPYFYPAVGRAGAEGV